jgi:membrane protease YdiL (CAAX protease family)
MDSAPEQPLSPLSSDHSSIEDTLLPDNYPPLETALPAPAPSTTRRLFFGPFGLRAGWSLLLYLAIVTAIIAGVQVGQKEYKAHHPQAVSQTTAKLDPSAPMKLQPAIIGEGSSFLVFLLVAWIMSRIERRPFSAFGLGGPHALSRFFTGAAWGVAALSLLVGALWALHLIAFDAQLDHGAEILRFGAAQLLLFLSVGLVEEYLFRGYLQFTLTRGLVSLGNLISRPHARTIAFWIAALFTSALFFAAHLGNSGESALGLVIVFLVGVVFLAALWRTGSLWWAIGFHTAWDWSQSFLYGVPDSGQFAEGRLFSTHPLGNPLLSGGTDGPEGSVLCIPILLLVILVLVFLTRPAPQPALETKDAPLPSAEEIVAA